MEMDDERNIIMRYLAVGGRRLSVFLSMMELPVEVLEHVLVAFLCVHDFLERKKQYFLSKRMLRILHLISTALNLYRFQKHPNNIHLKVQLSIAGFLSLQRQRQMKV